jgi:hypothetical protein
MAAKADRVDLLKRTLSGSEVSRPAASVRPAGCRLRNLVSETYPPAGVDTSLNRHSAESGDTPTVGASDFRRRLHETNRIRHGMITPTN